MIKWVCTRDHSRYTGKDRGAAHLRYKENRYVPVTGHNSFGYDKHLITVKNAEKVATFCDTGENTEKFSLRKKFEKKEG